MSHDAYLATVVASLYQKPCYTGRPDDCRLQGQAAGDQAYQRDANPYPVGTADREWWDAGWCDSLDELCGQ